MFPHWVLLPQDLSFPHTKLCISYLSIYLRHHGHLEAGGEHGHCKWQGETKVTTVLPAGHEAWQQTPEDSRARRSPRMIPGQAMQAVHAAAGTVRRRAGPAGDHWHVTALDQAQLYLQPQTKRFAPSFCGVQSDFYLRVSVSSCLCPEHYVQRCFPDLTGVSFQGLIGSVSGITLLG